jgi:cytochrome P450
MNIDLASIPVPTTTPAIQVSTPPFDELIELLPRLFTETPVVFAELVERYGSVVRLSAPGGAMEALLINEPELVREVLLDRDNAFRKGSGLQVTRELLGDGLLTSEGDVHARHRRLVSPAFHRVRMGRYAEAMAVEAAFWADSLGDGEVMDVVSGCAAVALAIVGRTLFAIDLRGEAGEVGEAVDELIGSFSSRTPLGEMLGQGITDDERERADVARASLDGLVAAMIAERRTSGIDHGDLLSALVAAADDDGSGLTDGEVRDEVMTLVLAGHETTANLLSWALFELGQSPQWADLIATEAETLATGRPVGFDDIEHLTTTAAVLDETLRLHPPAWATTRSAPDGANIGGNIGGIEVPPGGQVIVSPWLLHRDPRFWSHPECFDPTRWREGHASEARRAYRFVPFGAGARSCIGEHFARLEATIVLAEMCRRWRPMTINPESVTPTYSITMRATNARATLHRRN